MRNSKATTLIELLVGFLIATMLVLMIGSILAIGNTRAKRLRDESSISNNISYAYKFMHNRIRKAKNITQDTPTDPVWLGSRLIVDNGSAGMGALGVLQYSDRKEFVYLPNKNDIGRKEVFLSVPRTGNNDINFNFTQDGNIVYVNIQGQYHNIPFFQNTSIAKRIQ